MRFQLGSSVLLAGLLGVAAALLVSCGGSSDKLIPVADAGPLQSAFEEVAQAAEAGDGSCGATQTAIAKAEQDFNALPPTVDTGLRDTLRQGIDNLSARALTLCRQPLVQATTSTTARTTASTHTATAPTQTQTTTPTNTTPTTTTPATTTPTATTPGGGTVAPGEPSPKENSGPGGGTGVGEEGGAASAGGQQGDGPSAEGAPGQGSGK